MDQLYWVLRKSSDEYDFAIGPFKEKRLAERYSNQVMFLPVGTKLDIWEEQSLPGDVRQKLPIRDRK